MSVRLSHKILTQNIAICYWHKRSNMLSTWCRKTFKALDVTKIQRTRLQRNNASKFNNQRFKEHSYDAIKSNVSVLFLLSRAPAPKKDGPQGRKGKYMKANQDIRIKACEMGVHYWEIAKWLGIRPETFSRLLREELNPQQKEKVMRAIYEISHPIGHGHWWW